jgi:hypothetical protein
MARAGVGSEPLLSSSSLQTGASTQGGGAFPAATVSPGIPSHVNGKARSGGHSLQFPWKLHEMLDLAERNGHQDVISWLPCGKGFRVHKKDEFCELIMPSYFASKKYKTFQRSLNLWGFESVSKGPDRGACYHQYFLRGQPDVCHSMTRTKIKGQATTTAAAEARAASGGGGDHHQAAVPPARQQQQQAASASGSYPPLTPAGFPDHGNSNNNPGLAPGGALAGMANGAGNMNDHEHLPSLVSAFIRGKTRAEAMTAQHHQQQHQQHQQHQQQQAAMAAMTAGNAAAAAAAAAAAGFGFMGASPAASLFGMPHPGFGLGLGLVGGPDPAALSTLYGAELMARRASMERHHAMALATLLAPPMAAEHTPSPAAGGAPPHPTSYGSVGNGVPPSETESSDLVQARAADLAASATHVLQL